jgi:hypothetical protein
VSLGVVLLSRALRADPASRAHPRAPGREDQGSKSTSHRLPRERHRFTELGIEWGELSAATLVALPPMILIVTFQEWFNPGGIAGSVR